MRKWRDYVKQESRDLNKVIRDFETGMEQLFRDNPLPVGVARLILTNCVLRLEGMEAKAKPPEKEEKENV